MKKFEKYFIGDSINLNWEYINTIPEFITLETCNQNPKWHSEGNALCHTKMCLEVAYKKFDNSNIFTPDEKRLLLMAVLFHDIGKTVTTKYLKDNWHAYGHEFESEKITRRLLWNEDFYAREQVCTLVRYHMDVLKIAEGKNCFQKMIQMSYEYQMSWKYLLFVKSCDCLGSIPENLEEQREIDYEKLSFLSETTKEMNIYDNTNMYYIRSKAFDRPEDFTTNKSIKSIVNVIIGLPGAGKNTFIEKEFHNCVVLSRDDIRVELGYCGKDEKIIGTEEQEKQVTEVFNNRLKEAVKAGKEVVINNINLKKRYRDDYKQLVNNPNVVWYYHYIEAPSLEDNFTRRTMIPKVGFLNMIDKFDWPRCEEYDVFLTHKQF